MTETLQQVTGPQLTGPVRSPGNGGAAAKLVVFLHGLGADGNDLIDISAYWTGLLPDALFVSPNAHQPCDMAPMGRQWFSLIDRSATAMAKGADAALPVLNRFLDDLLAEHRLEDKNMALVGFSQGGMMALHVGLRRPAACAGIACYSSLLVNAGGLADDICSRPPIMLVHGDTDEVVPAAAMPVSEQTLSAAGISVESHLRPGLGHGIDSVGIELGSTFLQRIFDDAAP